MDIYRQAMAGQSICVAHRRVCILDGPIRDESGSPENKNGPAEVAAGHISYRVRVVGCGTILSFITIVHDSRYYWANGVLGYKVKRWETTPFYFRYSSPILENLSEEKPAPNGQ